MSAHACFETSRGIVHAWQCDDMEVADQGWKLS
jgi:hypothetical protein